MLIRSTPYACFVMLRNGLTLELVYDRGLTGRDQQVDVPVNTNDPAAIKSTSL